MRRSCSSSRFAGGSRRRPPAPPRASPRHPTGAYRSLRSRRGPRLRPWGPRQPHRPPTTRRRRSRLVSGAASRASLSRGIRTAARRAHHARPSGGDLGLELLVAERARLEGIELAQSLERLSLVLVPKDLEIPIGELAHVAFLFEIDDRGQGGRLPLADASGLTRSAGESPARAAPQGCRDVSERRE